MNEAMRKIQSRGVRFNDTYRNDAFIRSGIRLAEADVAEAIKRGEERAREVVKEREQDYERGIEHERAIKSRTRELLETIPKPVNKATVAALKAAISNVSVTPFTPPAPLNKDLVAALNAAISNISVDSTIRKIVHLENEQVPGEELDLLKVELDVHKLLDYKEYFTPKDFEAKALELLSRIRDIIRRTSKTQQRKKGKRKRSQRRKRPLTPRKVSRKSSKRKRKSKRKPPSRRR